MDQYSIIGFADQYIENQLNNLNLRCGDNLKLNSKISGVLLALFAISIVISAASAVDLVNNFNNGNFGIDVASGTNFTETVNVTANGIELVIFENSGNNSDDANSIIYFKDSTADKKEINGFIKDLESNGNIVEENDRYVVLKNTQNSNGFDIENDFDSIFNFASSIFSSDGLDISADGNSFSLSDKGLEIFDANGENVSITSDGISVSGGASFGNESVNVSSEASSNIKNSVYSIYLKNQGNDKVIVISGNNLELLKAMAETVSFNEN